MPTKQALVLIVEDDEPLCELNRLILEDAGYQVETTSRTDDPLAVARKSQPGVIVVRIQPGELNQWSLVDEFQADPEVELIPLVVLATSERAAFEAHAAPIVREVVIMPYDIDALRNAVTKALGSPPLAAVLPPVHRTPPKAVEFAANELTRNSRQIVLRTVRRLQEVEPFKSRIVDLTPGLLDDLPQFLGTILVGLARGLTPQEALSPETIRRAIREHVELRIGQSITLASLLEEYQVLNDEILEYLRDQIAQPPGGLTALEAFDIAATIDRFIAQMLRDSVNEFVARTTRLQRTRS